MSEWPDYFAWSGIVCGLTESRITMLMFRGGMQDNASSAAIVGGLSFLAWVAVFVWTFIVWSWWLPVAAFFAASILIGIAITRAHFAIFYSLRWIFAMITITSALALWIHGTRSI